MKTIALFDCNFLCYRAFHAMGSLSFGETSTGTIYGFLKDVAAIKNHLEADHLVFCFDYGLNRRRRIDDGYKRNRLEKRNEYTEEEKEAYFQFSVQVEKLMKVYLPLIGFSNVLYQNGFEADDLIASTCLNSVNAEDYVFIVSADNDLLQLLRGNIAMYNPNTKQMTTVFDFRKKYGIKPRLWAKVKALAGCSSDNVKGVKGVGEKTAIKYVQGELKESTVAYKSIKAATRGPESLYKRNLKMVRLPLKGTKVSEVKKDKLSEKGWKKVAHKLGLDSMEDSFISEISGVRRRFQNAMGSKRR